MILSQPRSAVAQDQFYSFEKTAAGQHPAGWTITGEDAPNETVLVSSAAHSPPTSSAQSLQYHVASGSASPYPHATIPTAQSGGTLRLDYYVSVSSCNGNLRMDLIADNTPTKKTAVLSYFAVKNGDIVLNVKNGATTVNVQTFTPGQWYQVRWEVDTANKWFNCTIDGTEVAHHFGYFDADASGNLDHWDVYFSSGTDTTVYFDDVNVFKSGVFVNTAAGLVSALSTAQPGDHIILSNGNGATYSAYNNFQPSALNATGSSGSNIVIRAETPGGVVFTGQTKITLKGQYVEFRGCVFDRCQWTSNTDIFTLDTASYCRVSDNRFYQCGRHDSGSDANTPFKAMVYVERQSHDNEIDHNLFEESFGESCSMEVDNSSGTNGNVNNTNNYFHHNYYKNIWTLRDAYPNTSIANNGMECIVLGHDQQNYGSIEMNTIVESNLFEGVVGDGAEAVCNKSSKNTFRYNTFRRSDTALDIRGGHTNVVQGNFFLNTTGGLRIYDGGPSGLGNVAYNNYFSDNVYPTTQPTANAIRLGADDHNNHKKADYAIVANNTVHYTTHGRGALYFIGDSNDTKASNTTIYNNVFDIYDGTGTTNAIKDNGSTNTQYYQNILHLTGGAVAPSPLPTGLYTTYDPAFSLVGELYRPSSTSPVIDFGTYWLTALTVGDDMDGQTRPNTHITDAGADEIVTGGSTRFPLTSADVGCSWLP